MFQDRFRSHFRLKYMGFIAFLWLASAACRQPAASTDPKTSLADSVQKNFFPVADYIRQEIRYVDSMPLALLRTTTWKDRTDSSFIKPEEFHLIAGEFLLPDLENTAFAKKFSENSFMDRTTGYLNFTYSALDKDLPLQRVDVVAIPAATATGTAQVKTIFMQTSASSGDTLVVKKMLWTAKRNLLIITSQQFREKPPVIRQVKVVWDSTD